MSAKYALDEGARQVRDSRIGCSLPLLEKFKARRKTLPKQHKQRSAYKGNLLTVKCVDVACYHASCSLSSRPTVSSHRIILMLHPGTGAIILAVTVELINPRHAALHFGTPGLLSTWAHLYSAQCQQFILSYIRWAVWL